MYILKFNPIYKTTLWGGNRLATHKNADNSLDNIAESWEISGVDGNETTVANGEYKGLTVTELVSRLKGELLGKSVYEQFGNSFPLLIKFIDAAKDLSIQVHPGDEMARREHGKSGKTEMWYVVDATEEATILAGLKKKITPEEYKQKVADKSICDAVSRYKATAGDVFYIPSGRIHSIGAGCLVAEIQQTSDVTYRIYDFDRRDKNGNLRELHTELAAQAIDYNVCDDYRTHYAETTDGCTEIIDSKYFKTSLISLTKDFAKDYSGLDSFVILMCVEGGATLTAPDGESIDINAYETVLVPAAMKEIKFQPKAGKAKFVETHL